METLQQRRGPGRPSNAELAQRQSAPSQPAASSEGEGAESGEMRIRRQNRRPFGSNQQKLFYPQRPGFHRHWFNDEDGRIEDAKAAGYENVKEGDNPVRRVVGTAKAGGPLYGYLMEIPEEWWEEDMARNQEQVDRTEQAIGRGEMITGKSSEDGNAKFYPTAQGRSISIGRR